MKCGAEGKGRWNHSDERSIREWGEENDWWRFHNAPSSLSHWTMINSKLAVMTWPSKGFEEFLPCRFIRERLYDSTRNSLYFQYLAKRCFWIYDWKETTRQNGAGENKVFTLAVMTVEMDSNFLNENHDGKQSSHRHELDEDSWENRRRALTLWTAQWFSKCKNKER